MRVDGCFWFVVARWGCFEVNVRARRTKALRRIQVEMFNAGFVPEPRWPEKKRRDEIRKIATWFKNVLSIQMYIFLIIVFYSLNSLAVRVLYISS